MEHNDDVMMTVDVVQDLYEQESMQPQQELEEEHEMTLTACLNRIMKRVQEDGYTPLVVEDLKEDFEYTATKMGIGPEETMILACVLEKGTGAYSCDDDDLSTLIGCTNIEFISYRKYIYQLSKKRIVHISKSSRKGYFYSVTMPACAAIIEDKVFVKKGFEGLDTEGMFSQMRKLFKALREEEIDKDMLLEDLTTMMEVNEKTIFCQRVVDYGIGALDATEQRIFYYLCHRYVSFGEKYTDFMHINALIGDEDDEQRYCRHFQAGNTKLQTMGLVTYGGEAGVMDKSAVALSDKVMAECFSEVELFGEEKVEGHRDLMRCDDIVPKELYYNESERAQVERLGQLLEQEHFDGIQARLEEMGMRKGFNIILYGGPGTGKTETTLQLAKQTGRDLLCIDMSKVKSKWVGDSEKAIKGVFNLYRRLCKNKPLIPILFFNEADAIFGKRMEHVESSAAQMLNSMQNIILQEMETLEGIMICTTNLHGNLDPAFERRFIYKVELNRPDESVRAKIWQSMLHGLADEDYGVLARKYPFSGGEIENVVRKSTIEYILGGEEVTLEHVCRLCDEEAFHSKVRKVGF